MKPHEGLNRSLPVIITRMAGVHAGMPDGLSIYCVPDTGLGVEGTAVNK